MDEEQQIISNMTTTIKPSSVTLFAFPEYIDPNVKDDMVCFRFNFSFHPIRNGTAKLSSNMAIPIFYLIQELFTFE